MTDITATIDPTQWIGGSDTKSKIGDTLPVYDPSNETLIAHVPRGCAADAEEAIKIARNAQCAWADLSVTDRAAQLREGINGIQDNRNSIAELLTRENGKPLANARAEIDAALRIAGSLIELGMHLSGRQMGAACDELLFQHCRPRGVAVCISTWNAPILVALEMVTANLIVGNTVILKTSERAPLATRRALETAFGDLPPGVISVLSGNGPNLGEPLVRHSDVDIVCFVGSVGVGRQIGKIAGERIRKAILELGGKDALIVDDTVDLAAAARLAASSCFANTGQICTSVERIYVMESVHDQFVEHLINIAQALKIGPGMDRSTEIGPLIDQSILDRVEQHIHDAVDAGAKVGTGGNQIARSGYFFPPTVLTRVTDEMTMMQEETFGPIAPILAVKSFEEAIGRSNNSEFGLSTIVCTNSAPRAIRAIHQLNSGMIKINASRGQIGACPAEPSKDSGLGMGHGIDFLQELVYRKSVHWKGSL